MQLNLKKFSGKYWLIIGLAAYFAASISSIVRSWDISAEIGGNLYMSADWFAACIIYFFYGGVLGWLVDFYFARKQNHKVQFPLWGILALLLWVISSAVVAIFNSQEWVSFWLILFFPLAFGIFFPGYAFSLLSPKSIEYSYFGKLAFDILFLAIFAWWLSLENKFRLKNRQVLLKQSLLAIIFAVFLLGFIGCTAELAG